ncbi:MAG: hypothetical protein PHN74_03385, partial [Candidatus Pacebacteria bacterium]|nr:hypothetical protein [Candidatus Paceibacterota bacterium]
MPEIMIIYLYGPDSYRRQEKLKQIISEYKSKHENPSLRFFDFEEEGKLAEFLDFAKSNSLFDNKKMAVVHNSGILDKKDLKEYIGALKGNLKTEDTILIINEDKALTKDFSFLPADKEISQEFRNLDGMDLQRFVWREVKSRGLEIDRDTQDLLMKAFSGNTWGLITELDKLSLLGEKKITKEIVKKYFDDLPTLDVFDALNGIRVARGVGARLAILEELFSRSQDPG